jgi:outer membrane protein TolC
VPCVLATALSTALGLLVLAPASEPEKVDTFARPFSPADVEQPFAAEDLQLSDVLRQALETNIELRSNLVDVEISESTILSALGAYDVILTAGLEGTMSETPQRGSQFTFSTGSRRLGGSFGFSRKLETGGTVSLTLSAARSITDQPVSIFDPSAGSTALSSYRVTPTLQLTHPLLKGAGIKVNRAAIDRARIATSQAEAQTLVTSQNMVRDIISAYWDVLFALRDLGNKRQSVELAEQQLERTRAQVAAGRLSPVDAKAVEQALAARESEVLIAENALLDRSLTLRTLMGQEFAEREVLGVTPMTDPVVRPRPIDPQEEIQRALEANPQVRQLQLALASKRIDELEAANQRLPQLDVQGAFTPQGRSVDALPDPSSGDPGAKGSWAEAFRNFAGEDVSRDGLFADWSLSGSISLTWDVQNRGPRGNHQRVLAEMRKAELNLRQIQQTIATSVIRAANGLRTAAKRIDVSQLSMELAEENLAAEQARFDVGRSTNYDVLERLDGRDLAAAEALSAQIEYLKAMVQLQALTSEILPAYGLDVP